MTKDYICVEMLLTSVYHWICAKVIMIFFKLFSNGLTQVGSLFDTDCVAVHTCHTVEHILLQYYIAKVFCLSLLLYSISYIVDLAKFFFHYYHYYTSLYTFDPILPIWLLINVSDLSEPVVSVPAFKGEGTRQGVVTAYVSTTQISAIQLSELLKRQHNLSIYCDMFYPR